MAEKGWYPLPSDPTKLMYFDGEDFIGEPVAAPSAPASTPPPGQSGALSFGGQPIGAASIVENLFGSAKRVAQDKEHQGTAMSVGGAAAIAEGTVGIRSGGILSGIFPMLIGTFFVIIAFVIGGVLNGSDGEAQRANEVKTTATISSFVYETHTSSRVGERGSSSDSYCIPYVTTSDGTEVRLGGVMLESPCPFTVGETVEVYVNPDAPGSERIVPGSKTSVMGLIFPLLFGGVGLFFALTGLVKVLKSIGLIAGGATLLGFGLSRRAKAREEKKRQAAEGTNDSPWS